MTIAFKAAVHDPKIASFRYRVEVPLAALRARGHAAELFRPEMARRYETVIFSKSYRPAEQAIARAVKARGGRVILDLCDNHFYNPFGLPRYAQAREDLLAMIALADRVVASTPALARIVREEAGTGTDVVVVGDVAERIAPPPRPTTAGKTLLWFGSHGSPNAPSGMNDLLAIAPELQRAAARTPFELVVASNDREKFARLAPSLGVPARYVAWTQEGFPALLAEADAVILPLSDNPFVACKTHNRITAALWPGVPVVAGAIESYREFAPFAWLDDWDAGLDAALNDPARARARAAGARAYIERHWSIERLVSRWEAALDLIDEGPTEEADGNDGKDRMTFPDPLPEAHSASDDAAVDAVRHSPPRHAAPDRPGDAPITIRREPASAGAKASAYQGALDILDGSCISGWARSTRTPDVPVTVTIEADGMVAGRGAADRPRPDLAAAGFRASACGFMLEVPDGWRDGGLHSFVIVADGEHVIERARMRFGAAGRARPAGPAAAPERAPAPLPAAVPPVPVLADVARSRHDIDLQKLLAGELETLDEAVEAVRRIASRIVLAAGGGGLAARDGSAGTAPREPAP